MIMGVTFLKVWKHTFVTMMFNLLEKPGYSLMWSGWFLNMETGYGSLPV